MSVQPPVLDSSSALSQSSNSQSNVFNPTSNMDSNSRERPSTRLTLVPLGATTLDRSRSLSPAQSNSSTSSSSTIVQGDNDTS